MAAQSADPALNAVSKPQPRHGRPIGQELPLKLRAG